MGLTKFVAPEIVFGVGARRLAARYARNLGAAKVLVVTDPGVAAAGWSGEIERCLIESGIGVATWSQVSPNPRAEEVMAGAAFYAAERCDVILAVGGGSPMDCAKGIGIVAAHGRHILGFEGVDQVSHPSPPLVCIPTTAGTSADVSQFAIITDMAERSKIAIISKAVVPDAALIDPETTMTMDPYLTACTGLDALCHAIEAFVSTAHSPVVDGQALEAVGAIRRNLLGVLRHPHDLDLRGELMLASMKAGLAFSNASLGAVHAMAHALGGLLDLAHGECNAMLLPHVVACNYDAAPERYDRVAEALGIHVGNMRTSQRREALLHTLIELKHAAGVTGSLSARGVGVGDLGHLSRLAARDACLITNPRKLAEGDLKVLYGEAL